jgi:hypothetical protein
LHIRISINVYRDVRIRASSSRPHLTTCKAPCRAPEVCPNVCGVIVLAADATAADWVQAWGSIGAVVGAALLLWWEIRARNEERHDQQATQARGVILDLSPTDFAGAEDRLEGLILTLTNASPLPIVDAQISIVLPDAGTASSISATILAPGAQMDRTWMSDRGVSRHLFAAAMADELHIRATFVDASGIRWERRLLRASERDLDNTYPRWLMTRPERILDQSRRRRHGEGTRHPRRRRQV